MGLCLTLTAAGVMGCQAPRNPHAWSEAAFTVATYNLFVDERNHDEGERMLRAIDADLVFLQEVSSCWEPVFDALRERYPYQVSSGDSEGFGNALLSRLPLSRTRHLPAEHGWHGAWFTVVETPVGPVQVLGVHLTPPIEEDARFTFGALLGSGPIHRREMRDFTRKIDFDAPHIILGDFNENERGAAAVWLRRRGLRSALMQFDLFTPTWTWVESSLVSLRLDHIFHSRDLEVTHAEVIPGGASDHQPVVAAFGTNGQAPPLAGAPSEESERRRSAYVRR